MLSDFVGQEFWNGTAEKNLPLLYYIWGLSWIDLKSRGHSYVREWNNIKAHSLTHRVPGLKRLKS